MNCAMCGQKIPNLDTSVCDQCRADAALGRAVRRDDFWELRKVRRVVRYGAIDPLSGVMPALEWADEYMAARHDGAGKVEWESGPTPKAALMAAGLMKGEER